ncbi:MAG: hypothetical protein KTR31_33215 [Myxococcales bacterium]|nr:hypothetical protein [Myxococcales bacterium]
MVIEATWTALKNDSSLSDPGMASILRCTLVHELVHALQHQYGTSPTRLSGDRRDGMHALWEGHATHVASTWCERNEGPLIARLVAMEHGIHVSGSYKPVHTLAKPVWGRALVAELDAEDPQLVWTALADQPPSWDDLSSHWAGAWTDPAPLEDTLRALGSAEVSTEPMTPGPVLIPLLRIDPEIELLPAARAGIGATSVAMPPAVAAMFLFDEPASHLVGRRASMQSGTTLRRLQRRQDVQRAWMVANHRDGLSMSEVWIASGHVLILLVQINVAFPARGPLQRTLVDLVERVPTTRPPTDGMSAAMETWLVELRDTPTPRAPVLGWDYREHRATKAVRSGSPTACADWFDDALQPGAVADPTPFARAALRCATQTEELALVRRAVALIESIDAVTGSHHGRAFVDNQRWADALEMADKAEKTYDGEVAQQIADVQLTALTMQGRLSRIIPLVMSDAASPRIRAWSAGYLMDVGMKSAASVVLDAVCPSLEGADAKPCSTANPSE